MTTQINIEKIIDSLVAQLDAAMREILVAGFKDAPAREHPAVGRVYRSLFDYLHNGGKRMHGISVLLAYQAVGGQPADAIVPVAAGFQLYHHHTLVHDDIYDQDNLRRGTPTIHRAFTDWFRAAKAAASDGDRLTVGHDGVFIGHAERIGSVAGIIQGKIGHALALEALGNAPFSDSKRLAALRALSTHDITDCASELMDVFHESSNIPGPETCLSIARLKTGRLFQVGVEIAAMLADATPRRVRALKGWIDAAATAFQLQDDLEDLKEESEKGLGRGIGTDLRTCKPTYVLSLAMAQADSAGRAILRDWVRNPSARHGDVHQIIKVLDASGAIDGCRRKVHDLLAEQTVALLSAEPPFDPEQVMIMEEFGAYFTRSQYWNRPFPGRRDPLAAGGGYGPWA
jgi:geranylgeranyl pyrophosphate synthase